MDSSISLHVIAWGFIGLMALTDVVFLTQEPKVNIRFSPVDATEHLRVMSVLDVQMLA